MANYIDEFAVKVSADDSKFLKELKKLSKTLKNTFNSKNTTGELSKDFKALNNAISSLNAGMIDWRKATREVNTSTDNIIKKYKKLGKEKSLQKGFWAQYGLGDSIKPLKDYIKKSKELMKQYSKNGLAEEYSKENEKYLKYKRYKRSGLKYTPEDIATLDRAETYDGLVAKSEQYDKDVQMLAKLKASYKQMYGSGSMDALVGKRDSIQSKMDAIIEQQGKQRKNHKKITGQEDLEKYRKQLSDINEQIENRKGDEKLIADYEGRVASYTEKEKQSFKDMKERYKETKENLEKGAQGSKGNNIWQKAWTKIKNGLLAFPRMLGRIVTRYFGYQLVKNFFGHMQEGVQNLYEWSRYNDQHFAKIMDKGKSLSVAVGNAFAVVRTYLQELVSKLWQGLQSVVIDILNWISRGLAQLLGQNTAVQASKDIMVRWSDNVKNTRQLIQGFDRLNIWKGTDSTLPQDMFYEVEVAKKKAKDVGKEMGESFVSYVLSSDPSYIGGLAYTNNNEQEDTSFWGNIRDFFVGLWEGIKLGWGKVKEWFAQKWSAIKLWWNGVTTEDEGDNGEIITRQVEPGFKHALKEWFAGVWEKVSGFFVGLWNEKLKPWFVEAWNKIKKWFDESIEPFMTRLADTLAKWWQNRKQVTNYQIEDWVYDKTGAVIDIEDTLRQFKRLMPWNWGKENLNATGGVYTTPHFGIVGEASTRANPELITPTALLDDRLQANNADLLTAMNGMINNVIGAINGVNMEVKIGDDVIARSASRGNNAYYRQTGRPLIR